MVSQLCLHNLPLLRLWLLSASSDPFSLSHSCSKCHAGRPEYVQMCFCVVSEIVICTAFRMPLWKCIFGETETPKTNTGTALMILPADPGALTSKPVPRRWTLTFRLFKLYWLLCPLSYTLIPTFTVLFCRCFDSSDVFIGFSVSWGELSLLPGSSPGRTTFFPASPCLLSPLGRHIMLNPEINSCRLSAAVCTTLCHFACACTCNSSIICSPRLMLILTAHSYLACVSEW